MYTFDIYDDETRQEVETSLEELRSRIAKAGMGVTLQGNRLTVRWGHADVHMVILSVDDDRYTLDEEGEIVRTK